jgi:hypothetical protein
MSRGIMSRGIMSTGIMSTGITLATRLMTASMLLLIASGATAAEVPERDQYAWGFPLQWSGDEGFYMASVPLSVYRSATDTQLRDSGVYNASGQPVPRIYTQPPAQPKPASVRAPLSFVPLFSGQSASPDDLRLRLRREGDGTTVLELDSGAAEAAQTEPAVLSGYIVDTRGVDQDLNTLEYAWDEAHAGLLGRINVEGSNDLQNWQNIGSSTLAQLSYDDASIEQMTTSLKKGSFDYLRLSWRDLPAEWRLDQVTGVFSDQPATTEREWLELEPVSHDAEAGEWIFDAGGFPPVDRVSVLLPAENVLMRATVFHRSGPGKEWRRSHNGVFYHLAKSGGSLESPAAKVGAVRTGEWKLRLNSGSVNGPVKLKLGWIADRLSFVAQGEGPFELAVGRALDESGRYPHHDMLGDKAIFRLLENSGSPGTAAVGQRQVLGGETRLVVAKPAPWRKIGLWIGLAAAVGLVGWLVLSLLRDLKHEDHQND